MNNKPPENSRLADNFKVAYFLVESFKKYIKREAILFTTFKEGKHWDAWHRKTLVTARAHDIAEVLNPDYRPVTEDEINLLEKSKNPCALSLIRRYITIVGRRMQENTRETTMLRVYIKS